ncbi:O-antigen ligase family protein [Qipengyuania sphaerica]|uniref:O-antigen ligase family protein n=1 Tax=Qipengyuania sphaerica TaxID=2867243 RepID=UPI001C886ECD|nr:O-antigen ligase family protein [Qipengyuania sphaerica]MBX7540827.1 O-antigen ligase family protein [Qipengyuania sphaerica]
MNFIIELAALAAMLWLVPSFRERLAELPLSLKVLCFCTLCVPLLQLVPVPPGLWQNVPGGDLSLESRELVGAAGQWFPLSVFPLRTAAALAALVVPLAMLLLYRRETMGVQPVLWLIVGLGAVNLLGGAMQIVSGQQWIMPYPIAERERLYGFFANHNSAGLLFVISTCALLGIRFDRKREMWKWAGCLGLAAAFLIGTVLTQSRSSTALMALPLLALLLRTLGEFRPADRGLPPVTYIAGLGAAVIGGLTLLLTSSRAQDLILRFGDLEDSRPQIWADTMYSIERFFPLGSGTGTFNEVFQLDESLEYLLPTIAGRAHNEYLEVGVESGIIGWVLIGAWLIWMLWSTWRSWRIQPSVATLAVPLALLTIALQSILDYPLRNVALLCLAGLLVAVLAAQARKIRDRVID